MESMWNNMESMWNNVESMWNIVESIWNDVEYHGVHGFYRINCGGFHLDSREIFHGILKFYRVSIWNEHGNLHQNGWALSQKYSIWNPWNPHGIGIHSTWNPPGMWGYSKDLKLEGLVCPPSQIWVMEGLFTLTTTLPCSLSCISSNGKLHSHPPTHLPLLPLFHLGSWHNGTTMMTHHQPRPKTMTTICQGWQRLGCEGGDVIQYIAPTPPLLLFRTTTHLSACVLSSTTPHHCVCYVPHPLPILITPPPAWTFTTNPLPCVQRKMSSDMTRGDFLLLCRVLAILTWWEGISISLSLHQIHSIYFDMVKGIIRIHPFPLPSPSLTYWHCLPPTFHLLPSVLCFEQQRALFVPTHLPHLILFNMYIR